MASPHALNIDHLARLARIELTADERAKFAAQLGDVLRYVEQLNRADTTGIEPTAHAFPVENVWAEDVAQPGLSVGDALRNAPAQSENMVSVPRVVE
jgi:aspartyl-tRNA(Asn)/glutamyl-tRNA(Gln) amidotransferase subunit C